MLTLWAFNRVCAGLGTPPKSIFHVIFDCAVLVIFTSLILVLATTLKPRVDKANAGPQVCRIIICDAAIICCYLELSITWTPEVFSLLMLLLELRVSASRNNICQVGLRIFPVGLGSPLGVLAKTTTGLAHQTPCSRSHARCGTCFRFGPRIPERLRINASSEPQSNSFELEQGGGHRCHRHGFAWVASRLTLSSQPYVKLGCCASSNRALCRLVFPLSSPRPTNASARVMASYAQRWMAIACSLIATILVMMATLARPAPLSVLPAEMPKCLPQVATPSSGKRARIPCLRVRKKALPMLVRRPTRAKRLLVFRLSTSWQRRQGEMRQAGGYVDLQSVFHRFASTK